jgi:hypothetical protein
MKGSPMRLSVTYLTSLVCLLACCADQAPDLPLCADLAVAPALFGQNPVVQGRLGSTCMLEPAPEGEIGSNCLDTESSCLTDSFGFPGGACVTIDQCVVATQSGCPANGSCFTVNGHAWCFQGCADDMDCRYDDGYRCQGGGCFPRCRSDDDCQAIAAGQLICDTGVGRCVIDRGCPAQPCAADEECVKTGTGEGAQCLGRCDMLAQDCGAKQTCVSSPAGVAVCSDTGFTAIGASCSAFDECQRGSLCAAGTCKPICDKTSDCTCGTDQAVPL